MSAPDTLLVGDLPKEIADGIVRDLAAFSVGFVRVSDALRRKNVELLGSGTLVSAGNASAILTAEHVINVLPKQETLGLLLWSGSNPNTVDTAGLHFMRVARGADDAVGPDLGAAILSPSTASSIAAQKSFYNLDRRREWMLTNPPSDDDGFWVFNGFVRERTTEELQSSLYVKRFFYLCAFGGADSAPEVDGFEYFQCPVSIEGRKVSPQSFGGMSGGGLWQIGITRSKTGELARRDSRANL